MNSKGAKCFTNTWIFAQGFKELPYLYWFIFFLCPKLWDFSSRDLGKEVLSHNSSLDLPSSRLWERISDEHLLGNLKGGKIFLAKPRYLCFIDVWSFSWNDGTVYLFIWDRMYHLSNISFDKPTNSFFCFFFGYVWFRKIWGKMREKENTKKK